jgi:hypothetical protein
MAHRVISPQRGNPVAFGLKPTSNLIDEHTSLYVAEG